MAYVIIFLLGLIVTGISILMILQNKAGAPRVLPIAIAFCGLSVLSIGFIILAVVTDIGRLNTVGLNLNIDLERQVGIMHSRLEKIHGRMSQVEQEWEKKARSLKDFNYQQSFQIYTQEGLNSYFASEIAWLQLVVAKKLNVKNYFHLLY